MIKKAIYHVLVLNAFVSTIFGMERDVCPRFQTDHEIADFLHQMTTTAKSNVQERTQFVFQDRKWLIREESFTMLKNSFPPENEALIFQGSVEDFYVINHIQFQNMEKTVQNKDKLTVTRCYYKALGAGRINAQPATINNDFYITFLGEDGQENVVTTQKSILKNDMPEKSQGEGKKVSEVVTNFKGTLADCMPAKTFRDVQNLKMNKGLGLWEYKAIPVDEYTPHADRVYVALDEKTDLELAKKIQITNNNGVFTIGLSEGVVDTTEMENDLSNLRVQIFFSEGIPTQFDVGDANIKVREPLKGNITINAQGQGTLTAEKIDADSTTVNVAGPSKVSIGEVTGKSLTATMKGSGELKILSGVVDTFDSTISTPGKIDIVVLKGNTVTAKLTGGGSDLSIGSGDIGKFSIDVVGPGKVNYGGNVTDTINFKVTGPGVITMTGEVVGGMATAYGPGIIDIHKATGQVNQKQAGPGRITIGK